MVTTTDPFTLGRDLLGPVFALYLLRLCQTIDYFEHEREARVLFVSRAGIRIRALYEAFCAARNSTPSSHAEIFWTSRLLTAKGIWSKCPGAAMRVFAKEYACVSLGEAVTALLRGAESERPKLIGKPFSQPASQLGAFLDTRHPAARAVTQHLREQSALFGRSFDELVGNSSRVVLVDSGWQGTAQTLLAGWRPDIEWWGAYLGRFGFADSDRSQWSQMLGLMFEADQARPDLPESFLSLHRHLAERLLEPRGPSIEALAQDASGVRPIGATDVLADNPTADTDPFFCGVLSYIQSEVGPASVGTIFSRGQAAWPQLARMLAYPSLIEAQALGCGERSADFGRTLTVPILIPPVPRSDADRAEPRVADSLWPQGQIAIEYAPVLALKEQAKRLPQGCSRKVVERSPTQRAAEVAAHWEALSRRQHEAPRVAVVTRTMDRPIMLKRALASVARQHYDDYVQVVVCDGGPIAPIIEAIESSGADLRRVRLIDNVVNRGMEAASNIGIRHSQSKYVIIHDDDDTWEPAFLDATVSFLDSQRGQKYLGVVTHSTYVSEEVVGDQIIEHGRNPYNGWMRCVYLEEMIRGNFFPPIGFLFRRKVCDEIGGFAEDLPVLGDWDFNLRCLLVGDIAVIQQQLANYHHRDVGNVALYGNTVVAGADAHAEYDAIVRNRYLRSQRSSDHAVAALMGNTLLLSELRNRVRSLEHTPQGPWPSAANPAGGPSDNASMHAEIARLYAESQAIRASTSWRLTSPLRSIAVIGRRMWEALDNGLRRFSRPNAS